MSEVIPEEYNTNYEQFRDILSSFLIERIATPFTKPKPKPKRRSKKKPTNSPPPTSPDITDTDPSADDLADFTSYIATATFLALPPDLQSLTYHTWIDNPHFESTLYPLPLTAERTTTLLHTLDPSIPDSLATYGITAPPSTTPSNLPSPAEFLAPVLGAYISATTVAPPPPASTKADAAGCEICGRDWINLSYHHLIPRMVHDKAVKRGWHRADQLQNVAWLCGACHRFVHRFAGHEVLAREYYTVERLLQAEEVRRFGEWVGRVRWKAR
ncbi:hypothetical protein CHGG_09710 [Chaetomium globosum CBS 148.51]|uniref:HNH domain-containing protein n=1 Tax=Chaetomium globosum (strain ATCC 6205 / CBS 148.51 / DSM 1962 / NBRC 6347 / NRRL 1970) TaxID=306901 RepID=Q2GQP4_CHAGB|nr:uncharacterized protein CHGG_09710 [Chaetomium globosum CBS 148.51]EAQ83306.1 hypothetical protein CHGG_09710 [Chaetomium globosum CBS 148.51]